MVNYSSGMGNSAPGTTFPGILVSTRRKNPKKTHLSNQIEILPVYLIMVELKSRGRVALKSVKPFINLTFSVDTGGKYQFPVLLT